MIEKLYLLQCILVITGLQRNPKLFDIVSGQWRTLNTMCCSPFLSFPIRESSYLLNDGRLFFLSMPNCFHVEGKKSIYSISGQSFIYDYNIKKITEIDPINGLSEECCITQIGNQIFVVNLYFVF